MSKAPMNINFMAARKPLGVLSLALVDYFRGAVADPG